MLSIIIPTYNEEKYLPKLLRSIKKQSFKDYEIIVADNNSKDRTRKIAKKYGCRITKGGKHPAIARNNGAKISKGDLLFFIDADCVINKNFFQKALKEMKNKNIDVAGCYVWLLSNKVIDNLSFAIFNLWMFSTQLFYPNASGAGIFCKKDLHQKIKGFDEKIIFSEDMDYAGRAGKHRKFRILNSVKAYTSARRFDEEGRFKLYWKLILSAIYRALFGEIKTNIFKNM